MSETPTGKAGIKADEAGTPEAAAQEHAVYTYESAGIAEREGNVPLWLWVVVVSLVIWGGYYLLAYWNAPGGPS